MRSPRRRTIERQIERQHVHPRLAQKPEGTSLDLLVDELTYAIFRHVAGFRNTRHLEKRGVRRDVGVEAAARSS